MMSSSLLITVRGAAVRVHSPLHLELHLDVRELQGQVHAEPSRAPCVCLPSVAYKE